MYTFKGPRFAPLNINSSVFLMTDPDLGTLAAAGILIVSIIRSIDLIIEVI